MSDAQLRNLERLRNTGDVEAGRQLQRARARLALCHRCDHLLRTRFQLLEVLCVHCSLDLERGEDTRGRREEVCLCGH